VAGGLTLGALIAAVQLLPMAAAVQASQRPLIRSKDFWSFHPLALIETVAQRFFGDLFLVPRLDDMPWVRVLNSGREPFFYSAYLGVPVLALACFGAVVGWRRRWGGFWVAAGLVGLVAAFGGNTPIYPFVRTHLPVLGSFRFPVKYLVVSVLAIAALVAAGWDAVAHRDARQPATRRDRIARAAGVMLPLALGLGSVLLWVAVQTPIAATARWCADLAAWVGVPDPPHAAAFLMGAVRDGLWKVALLALGAAALMAVASSRRPEARVARAALFSIVAIDLLNAAWGLNPTCQVELLAAPSWASVIRAHPESRFYLGGKRLGSIIPGDPDAPSGITLPVTLPIMVQRAILARHVMQFPAGVGAREMLSFDLPVLWPRVFNATWQRFAKAPSDARERFLGRTAVRYRILPVSRGAGRPAMAAGAFVGVQVYDFGPAHTRAFVVRDAVVVPAQEAQSDALFGSLFDDHQMVMLARAAGPPEGTVSAPVEPFARIVEDRANRVTIEAGTGPAGGFLVLLDTYSPDWSIAVDGRRGTLYPANLLFRAVHLAPGRHVVEFRYRPQAFLLGGAGSLAGLLGAAFISLRAGSSKPA
jgi:hypothetical protein